MLKRRIDPDHGSIEPAGEAMNQQDIREQRSRAVKTAWVLAAIAALIFISFILSGVLGS